MSADTKQNTMSHLDPYPRNPAQESSARKLMSDVETDGDSIQDEMARLVNVVHWVLDNGELDGRLFYLFQEEASDICAGRYSDRLAINKIVTDAITENFNRSFKVKLDEILSGDLSSQKVLGLAVSLFASMHEISRIFMALESYLRCSSRRKSIKSLAGKLIARNFLRDPDSPLEELCWEGLTYRDLDGKHLSSYDQWQQILECTAPFVKRNLLTQLPQRMGNTYAELADMWIQDPSLYVPKVIAFMEYEMRLIKNLKMPPDSRLKVMEAIRWTFLFRNFSLIMEQCMHVLVINRSYSDIQKIFAGAKDVDRTLGLNNVKIMHFHWKNSLSREVDSSLDSSQRSNQDIIASLAKLRRQLNKPFKLTLDESFQRDISTAFRERFNDSKYNPRILGALSKYCDQYLRTLRKKHTTEAQVSFTVFRNDVLVMFDCISNKDDFLELYKRDLGRRLLFRRGSIQPQEIEMIDEFATLIGENNGIIQSMRTMFNDILNPITLRHNNLSCQAQISMNALDSRCWPDIPKMNTALRLPATMQQSLDQLTSQYHEQGRRTANQILDWSHYGLHQLELEASFGSEKKILVVNLLQAIVLLQFEEGSKLTADEVGHMTLINPSLLSRVLHSLSLEKVAVLSCQDGKYGFNDVLTNKQKYIKVPFAREMNEHAKLGESTFTERNRQDEYRSQIVRIMKKYRQLPFATLISRALQACQDRGPVTIQDMKQAVEYLIRNEYLQRIGKNLINYLP